MGRGGGGGSSHSSSHHSSSRSHSGSSRSSGSSYRSSGSSYRSSGSSYSRHSRSSGSGGYSGGGRIGSGCGGCSSAIFFVLLVLAGFMYGFLEEMHLDTIYKVTRSSIQREKLPEDKCKPIDEWYKDDWGDWIDENGERESLETGLKYFYESTGVQPYLWIMGEDGKDYKSTDSLEELAEVTYKKMFGNDEGHILIIFREYPNESGNYLLTVTPGFDAETQVMDQEAKDILLDYIEYYYEDDDLNEGTFFQTAFRDAGERIMTKQVPLSTMITAGIIVLVLILGLVITINIVRKRRFAVKQQKAKQVQAEKDKAIVEQNQKKYQEALAQTYVTVVCPNCGSTDTSIRKGTVGYCNYCGTAMKADENGNVVIYKGNESET